MISKYKKPLIVFIIVLVFLFIIAKATKKKSKDYDSLSAIFAARATALGLDINQIWVDTQYIFEQLGIDMFWDEWWMPIKIPAPWENETGIVTRIRTNYNTLQRFDLLADVYNERWKRNLRQDLRKYLSDAEQAQIPQL